MKFALSFLPALLVATTAAPACMVGDAQLAYVHSELPEPLPAKTIIAFVNFQAATDEDLKHGVSARVERVVQGDYKGSSLLLKPSLWTSCDQPFANGQRGYIVGVANGFENGVLVVDPITVSRGDGFRLPNGFQLKIGRSNVFDWDPATLQPVKPNKP